MPPPLFLQAIKVKFFFYSYKGAWRGFSQGEDGEISTARGSRAFATRQRTIAPHLSEKGGKPKTHLSDWTPGAGKRDLAKKRSGINILKKVAIKMRKNDQKLCIDYQKTL